MYRIFSGSEFKNAMRTIKGLLTVEQLVVKAWKVSVEVHRNADGRRSAYHAYLVQEKKTLVESPTRLQDASTGELGGEKLLSQGRWTHPVKR